MNVDNIHNYYYQEFKLTPPNSYSNIELTPEQEFLVVDNFRFVVMKNDTCIADSLRNNEIFEKFLISIVSEIIPRNKNIMDIGSNIGLYSIILSKIINKENYIYAFEPQPKIFDCLEKNIVSNNSNNVIPYRIGLSEKNTTLLTNASYESKRGDDLHLDNIGFIKIDTKGNELSVLNGLKETIEKNMPIIRIEIQSHDNDCDQKINFFYSINYRKIYKITHCDYLVLP
jgi:hypothetical protein